MAIAILIPVLAVLLSGILLMRFRKRSLAAFNVAVTNKITGRFADRLPGFGIVTHLARLVGPQVWPRISDTGKRLSSSQRISRRPHLRSRKWVKNVLAARGCELQTRGRRYQLTAPTVVHDPTRKRFPLPVRIILGFVGANDFMELSIAEAK